jgi:hypothetical protein
MTFITGTRYSSLHLHRSSERTHKKFLGKGESKSSGAGGAGAHLPLHGFIQGVAF